MSEHIDLLKNLSAAFIEHSTAARSSVVAIRLSEYRHLTGTLWQSGFIITSEQSLPDKGEFEVILPGGEVQGGKLAGRDPGTNIALIRLDQPVSVPALASGDLQVGALVLAAGADGRGGGTARLGTVNQVGPEWHSSRGGRIDHYIAADLALGRSEEGGPVFDASGGCLGMSTFGPRGRILVIPAATIERVIPLLQKDGRVRRGWLGITLQPVAVPDAFHEPAGQSTGLMVMSIVDDGPAARAGVVAGDIVLTVNRKPVPRYRNITSQFGPESLGRKVALRVIRGGNILSLEATIAERPSA